MKIPIFEEVMIKSYDEGSLRLRFQRTRVGKTPAYVLLHHLNIDELSEALNNMATVLKDLKIHPHFPYPFYVITKLIDDHPLFPIAGTVAELPRHYFKKIKRPTKKESALLNKVGILANKISNISLYERNKDIEKYKIDQRELYRATKELNFYETILEDLEEEDRS